MAPRDKLAGDLRAAVISGDHVLATRLTCKYAEALAECWRALPVSERAGSEIPERTRELLTWAREITLVQRAMTTEHLDILRKAIRYEPSLAPERRSSSIRVEV